MNDGDRIYPVNYFFLHHSTGPDFKNASDLEVQDWYSNTGKARAYNNGAINPRHEHPSRPGELTYAQAQFTLREYTLDGNKYGWRLTDLIARPWWNVAWAVGNWWYNQRSCSVETCGNFLDKLLPDKALMLLADFLRPIDQELGGALQVWLHLEVYATACPARIKEQRDKVVDMINRPDYWNNILWPPKPDPITTHKDETSETEIPFVSETIEDGSIPKGERRIKQAGVKGLHTVTTRITYVDGKETKREVIWDNTVPAVNEIILVGTYEAPVNPIEPGDGEDAAGWIVRLLSWAVEILRKFTFKK